jgi:protein O-GlcNAc transferase
MKSYSALKTSASRALTKGNLKKAEKDCRKLEKLNPADDGIYVLHGVVNLKQSRHSDAKKNFQKALNINARNQDALNNLGAMYNELGKYDDAIKYLQMLLDIAPKQPEALNNFGTALLGIAQKNNSNSHRDQSIEFFKEAITNLPTYAVAHKNLGIALLELKDYQGAIDHLQSAVDLDPSYETARTRLTVARLRSEMIRESKNSSINLTDRAGNPLTDDLAGAILSIVSEDLKNFDFDMTRNCLEELRRLDPLSPELANANQSFLNLSWELQELTNLTIQPDGELLDLRTSSLHYFYNLYHYPVVANKIGKLTQKLREKFELHPAKNLSSSKQAVSGKFRLGVFSGDLKNHVVVKFLRAIFDHLDKSKFELYVFSFTSPEDSTSDSLKRRCDYWVNIEELSDENCADLISEKQIDALLDLSGHTNPNRAGVLLRKPTRKQISWLGFPSTTGFNSIDHIIGDEITIPPSDESFYTEKVLRLPNTSICFTPSKSESDAAVSRAPKSAVFRFASLNNLLKVNPEVVRSWAAILNRVPNSELLIKDKRLASTLVQKRLLSLFLDHDIDEARLQFFPMLSQKEHLAFFDKADLALDPFPYNGTTTSCEALYMGLPTLTLSLPGPMVSHQGELINKLVGNEIFTTYSIDEYVDRAVELSSKRSLLEGLRKTSRDRMMASPLCDAPEFCREFEKLLLSL